MKDTLQKIREIFSSHYAMERFGILFFSLVACMTVLLGTMEVKRHKDNQKTLSEQVIYTREFTTSLTGQSGRVQGIFHNEERTKCFILLKFNDMSAMSINAENYQMFITGYSMSQKQEELKTQPYGCIYVFGTTGYMGIYLTSAGGFEKQIMGLTVRCNKTIVNTAISGASSLYMDSSFDTYDQFRLYFNPGGDNVALTSCFDSDRFDIFELYEEMVTRPREAKIRERLNSDLNNMKSAQIQMEEYEERLIREGVIQYTVPSQILGDTIVQSDDGHLDLTTNTILPYGIQYDWYNGSIKDGYLDAICGEDISYSELLNYLKSGQEEEDDIDEEEVEGAFSTNTIWYLSNGVAFDGNDSLNIDIDEATRTELSTATELLQGTWRKFYNNKRKYQCEDLVSLLELEIDAKEAKAHYTINTRDYVLQWY